MSTPVPAQRMRILGELLARRRAPRSIRQWDAAIQALVQSRSIAPAFTPTRETAAGLQPARLRVAIFTRWQFPHLGGLSTYIKTLQRGLGERHHHVTVVSENSLQGWKAVRRRLLPGLARRLVRRYGPRGKLLAAKEASVQAYARLVRRLDLRRYDVLHAQDLFTANILIDLRAWHGRPIVYTPHGIMTERNRALGGIEPTSLIRLYYRVADHIAATGADHIIVLTEAFAGRLARYGASEDRLTVSPSGIRDPGIPAPDADAPGNSVTITYIGRMKASKGPQIFLRAMARIRRPGTRIWLVGDGISLPALRQLARKLELRHVTFHGQQNDIHRFLKQTDILVIPGLDETFPMVGIEGLFAGRAIVASRSGGITEMIEDGRTGLLFPPGDVQALARQILRLLDDPDLRLQLGAEAQRQARIRFSADRMLQQIEAVYACLRSAGSGEA